MDLNLDSISGILSHFSFSQEYLAVIPEAARGAGLVKRVANASGGSSHLYSGAVGFISGVALTGCHRKLCPWPPSR